MVTVLLKVFMPVVAEDTVSVIVAAVDCPALSVEPFLFQVMLM